MSARRLATVLAFLTLAGAARAEGVRTQHLEVELVPMTAAAAPGKTVWIGLRQTIADGWHTYWKNSGDAGQATQIAWTLPAGWRAGEITWAAPKRLREASLMTYGYEGRVMLPVPVQVPATARPGTTVPIRARADFLVCKDLCVPESAELSLNLPVAASDGGVDLDGGAQVAAALEAAPKPAGITAHATLEGGVLKLSAVGGPLKGADAVGAYFFPDTPKTILHPARQAVERGPEGLTLSLAPAPALAAGGLKAPLSGVLQTASGAWTVTAEPGPPLPGASGLGAAPAADDAPAVPKGAGGGLPLAIVFAFLGGVLLNLMPCVFPVLAMKAAAFTRSAHSPKEARTDGLAFLGGVMTTFLALGAALALVRAAGGAVGWGFQLQSPYATAFLALLTLALGLNLSGVFKLGLALQGAGARAPTRDGPVGAFLTGVLAVIVGAPCTAPLMGAAMGYALTAPAAGTLAVFAALGLGFGLPFLALSFSPALLKRLPRPGAWMSTLQHLLAFPMYATAAWMVWVFAQQTGAGALGLLLGAGVALGLALYLFGRVQVESATGGRAFAALGGAAVAWVAAVALALAGAGAPRPAAAGATVEAGPALQGEPWSPARVAELRAQGRPVFVNFTAAWCVTCKVNEAAALSSPEVRAALARTNGVYLVADWTRKDETIARALAEQGRSGVPLYLVWRPGAAEPEVLPQLLTAEAIVRALEKKG